MSYIPAQTNQKGAFGELMTSHKTPIVQIANKYRIDPTDMTNIMEVFSATGGTADNNGNLFRCQSGTSVGGYGVVRSTETLNYRAGQGVESMFTAKFTTGVANSLQFGGMFNLTETIAFGYDGANFSCLHSYGGLAELQIITITATPSGTENTTVTLDSDAVVISVTNSTTQTNAEEIRAGLAGDATVGGKWRFEQVDNKVYCISKSVGDKTGTFSILTTTMSASISEDVTGAAKTDGHIAQANWNLNAPFSGFDPTKINVYKIRFGYLGAANITYSIYDPTLGDFVDVHQIEWANANTITHLGSPNLKVGWTAASLGSSGTNLTVEGASATIELDGDEIIKNNTFADFDTVGSVGTTFTNLITLKNRLVFNDVYNLGKLFPLRVSIDNEHNKGMIIEILRSPTVSGTVNYQFEDEFNSTAVSDKSGTTVSGGTLIDAFTVPANGDVTVDLTILRTELLPDETFVIAGRTVTGTATNTTVTVTWKEEK